MLNRIRLATALSVLWFLVPPSSPVASAQAAGILEESAGSVDNGITVPFEFYKQHIFVTLAVNGKQGMVFLFDTGASVDVLNLKIAQALGLHCENITKAKDLGLGGGKVSIAGVRDLDVVMGSAPLASTMAIVDLSGLERFYGHRTDGIIGFPLLKRFVVEVNFEKQLLTLLPLHGYKYRGTGDIMGLSSRDNVPSIPITVYPLHQKGRDAVVEVDTGSDASLLLYPQFAHRSHLEDEFVTMDKQRAYGLGGIFWVRPGVLGSMAMGHTMVSQFTALLLQSDPQVARHKIGGIIGTTILDSYSRVIFDAPRGRIIFEADPKFLGPPVSAPSRSTIATLR